MTGLPFVPEEFVNKAQVSLQEAMEYIHPEIKGFCEYWESKKREGKLPSRSDIDPLDLIFYLPRMWMLDVHYDDPLRFKVRLHGTEMVEKSGMDKTGKFMDDTHKGFNETIGYRNMCKVVTDREPIWFRGQPSHVSTIFVRELEYVMLPLSKNGEDVDILLCLTYTDFSKREEGMNIKKGS